ncbi:MAG TPA: hypothetical protein VIG29_21865, partial [Vicinamibacteria bacterium]
WILSWCLYQLPRDPLRVFDANIFYPEPGTLALSENLLTGALLVSPVALFSASPVLLFNVALLAGFVATAYAAFLLAYDLTGSRLAAGLGGILFAFAPYRFAHIPHLQLQLAFGIPLSLCFVRRLLFDRRALGSGLALAASVPLTFGSCIYYTLYGATVAPVLAAFEMRGVARAHRLRAVTRLGLAAAAGTFLTLPLALPYWRQLESGMGRSLETASEFEATPADYFSSYSLVHGFLPKTSEPLFPGFVAIGLALAAVTGGANERRRTYAWLALAAVGVLLSFGPSIGLFSLLYELLPPYRALRVPSRAGVLFLLGMAMLAAIGLGRVRGGLARKILVLFAAIECFAAPLALNPEPPRLPPIYAHFEGLEEGALLELPLPPPERFQDNAVYLFRTAYYHHRPIVNGYSGFVPESYRATADSIKYQPIVPALDRLHAMGVRFVLAHEGRLGPRMVRELSEAERSGRLEVVALEGTDRLLRIRGDGGSTARRWSPAP